MIAPDTIITMPSSTIRAFQDHGKPDVGPFTSEEIARSKGTLDALATAGVDHRDVTERVLEREGIGKFDKSFDELMQCIETKARELGRM